MLLKNHLYQLLPYTRHYFGKERERWFALRSKIHGMWRVHILFDSSRKQAFHLRYMYHPHIKQQIIGRTVL